MSLLKSIDAALLRVPAGGIFGLSVAGVAMVGIVDFLVGYEISVSLFYLAPVAIAAWYGGPRDGITLSGLACVSWYAADVVSGHPYSHPAIPVWNAAVRFGFFAVVAGLVCVYHDALRRQRQLLRTDPLTGLANRRAFGDALAHDLALARRRGWEATSSPSSCPTPAPRAPRRWPASSRASCGRRSSRAGGRSTAASGWSRFRTPA